MARSALFRPAFFFSFLNIFLLKRSPSPSWFSKKRTEALGISSAPTSVFKLHLLFRQFTLLLRLTLLFLNLVLLFLFCCCCSICWSSCHCRWFCWGCCSFCCHGFFSRICFSCFGHPADKEWLQTIVHSTRLTFNHQGFLISYQIPLPSLLPLVILAAFVAPKAGVLWPHSSSNVPVGLQQL